MSHFGPKVIGEEAYQEQKQLAEEGRLQFGPRVVGPYQESVHGKRVVEESKTEFDEKLVAIAGKPRPLTELTLAELEKFATALGVPFKQKTPKPVLIKKIESWDPEKDAPEEE